MKKIRLLIAFEIIAINLCAQNIGIGTTTPNASAVLEIKASNKGLLIPRTSTASRTSIVNPAKGLMLYDTTTSSFWFHNGSAWTQIGAGGNGWSVTGNAGTNPSANFIGTTDQQSLIFKVNNTKAGFIDYSTFESGTRNTALGLIALGANTSGADNTANGYGVLYSNQTGNENSALGKYALFNNNANDNTAIGFNAMFSNLTGTDNTATGSVALQNNTTGIWNTATGAYAMYQNQAGGYNTAMGGYALQHNVTGVNNVASGYGALNNNTSGYSNVGIGILALNSNTDRSNLVAIGDSALFNNGIGATDPTFGQAIDNTAVGSKALYSNSIGTGNTATGYNALYANTTAGGNTAYGALTLYRNITGRFNTAIGETSLDFSNGDGNTAVGDYTLSTNITGSNNTALGTGANVSSVDYNNATALGYNAVVHASNTVQVGNTDVTDVYFGTPATTVLHAATVTPSDARFKYNIKNDIPGLSFIMQLKPVTYNFNAEKLNHFIATGKIENNDASSVAYANNNIQTHSGFIAQDVEKAANFVGYDFDGIITTGKNSEKYYSLSYSQFVVPLIKAVQEEQQEIELLKRENAEIKKQLSLVEELRTEINTLKQTKN